MLVIEFFEYHYTDDKSQSDTEFPEDLELIRRIEEKLELCVDSPGARELVKPSAKLELIIVFQVCRFSSRI